MSKKINVECFSMAGHRSNCEIDLKKLIKNLFPHQEPPTSTIIIESTFDGKPAYIKINATGIDVRTTKF